jgi:hypothetical protein
MIHFLPPPITHPECGNCNMRWNMEQFQHTMWLTASHSCNRGSIQFITSCILFLCLHTHRFLMLFCSNKCALKHLFWLNSSFSICRLFSWSIKIYYQQHGICQVHFFLKLSNLWHYLHSSVRVNTIMSQFHPFHMPRKNAQRNTLMFSTHLLCLLNVDTFRGFYQKV